MKRFRAPKVRWLCVGLLASALAPSLAPTLSWAQVTPDRDRQPRSETEGQGRESLSDRLDRTDGVIRPPSGVDPQMQVPPPEQRSRTPVIPPPGTPGGDRTIEPK
jgi:hypothetical protein